MKRYYQFAHGLTPVGAIVVRLYRSGDQVRGFIREIPVDENEDSIFPSEELSPETAFRLAENKRFGPQQPLYVELKEGVTWNEEWGELV